jgi:hypothetical protein
MEALSSGGRLQSKQGYAFLNGMRSNQCTGRVTFTKVTFSDLVTANSDT